MGGGWERVRAVVECRGVGLGHHVAEHVVSTLRVFRSISQSWSSSICLLVLISLDRGNVEYVFFSSLLLSGNPLKMAYIRPVIVMRQIIGNAPFRVLLF